MCKKINKGWSDEDISWFFFDDHRLYEILSKWIDFSKWINFSKTEEYYSLWNLDDDFYIKMSEDIRAKMAEREVLSWDENIESIIYDVKKEIDSWLEV